MVAAAVIGGAVIGAGASSVAANKASKAQESAANASAGVQREAIDSQEAIYKQQREDQAPYREVGYESLAALRSGMGMSGARSSGSSVWGPPARTPTPAAPVSTAPPPASSGSSLGTSLLSVLKKPPLTGASESKAPNISDMLIGSGAIFGTAASEDPLDDYDTSGAVNPGEFTRDFTLADFTADPGYAFRMSEGEKAIQRGASARGLNLSGATLKALNRFNSGNAAQEYGSAFDRFNVNRTNKFNRLSTLAGIGQTANAQTSAAGSQYGNAVGNYASGMSSNLAAIGNASAANSIAQGNAVSGTLNGLANNYMTYQLLKG